MAFYVSVPRDLSRVKTKVFFNLTKRQMICFGLAACIGLPVFFLLKEKTGGSIASMGMILSMLPLFFMAMYEKNGMPAEELIRLFYESRFRRPKQRPYRTENSYTARAREENSREEEDAIVCGNVQEKRKSREE